MGLAAFGLPRMLQPLHINRAGQRAAGLWLAGHAHTWDDICDGHFGWAFYYAGRLFLPAQALVPPPNSRPTRYVVKGRSLQQENPYGPTEARADMTEAEIRAAGGKVVYHWPTQRPLARADVVVWAVRLPRTP